MGSTGKNGPKMPKNTSFKPFFSFIFGCHKLRSWPLKHSKGLRRSALGRLQAHGRPRMDEQLRSASRGCGRSGGGGDPHRLVLLFGPVAGLEMPRFHTFFIPCSYGFHLVFIEFPWLSIVFQLIFICFHMSLLRNISSIMCQKPEMKLSKGAYYHSSFAPRSCLP